MDNSRAPPDNDFVDPLPLEVIACIVAALFPHEEDLRPGLAFELVGEVVDMGQHNGVQRNVVHVNHIWERLPPEIYAMMMGQPLIPRFGSANHGPVASQSTEAEENEAPATGPEENEAPATGPEENEAPTAGSEESEALTAGSEENEAPIAGSDLGQEPDVEQSSLGKREAPSEEHQPNKRAREDTDLIAVARTCAIEAASYATGIVTGAVAATVDMPQASNDSPIAPHASNEGVLNGGAPLLAIPTSPAMFLSEGNGNVPAIDSEAPQPTSNAHEEMPLDHEELVEVVCYLFRIVSYVYHYCLDMIVSGQI